jgi:hypothetical protein
MLKRNSKEEKETAERLFDCLDTECRLAAEEGLAVEIIWAVAENFAALLKTAIKEAMKETNNG